MSFKLKVETVSRRQQKALCFGQIKANLKKLDVYI